MSADASTLLQGAPLTRTRSRYFQIMSGLLLAIVLLGFARSFYLRPMFLADALPVALVVHGSLLTVWFLLAFIQASLIAGGRTALHRSLGYTGAAWAIVVLASGLIATLGMAVRVQSPADREHMIVWGNLLTLLAFGALVLLGVLRRNQAAFHRRYMLMASIAIIGPPLGRVAEWPGMPGGPPLAVAYAIGGIVLLFATLVLFDRRTLRRVHRATWVGMALTLASIALTVVSGKSPAALTFLKSLVRI
jgi:FtsH-binding integral membrane protein